MKQMKRFSQPEFHIVAKCDVWKVYDRNQRYRCTFHSRQEAEAYIAQHSKSARRLSR